MTSSTIAVSPRHYGIADKAGPLNKITPAHVLSAVALVRRGDLHDLAHLLHADCHRTALMPQHGYSPPTSRVGPTAITITSNSRREPCRGVRSVTCVTHGRLASLHSRPHSKELAMSDTPIADHALLSDRHSCALVSTAGSVEWLSFPRFDSPSMFGRLHCAAAGYWQIKPTNEWRSSRRYVDRTLVLETTFSTETGTVVLTDLLAVGPNNSGHRLGRDVPHLLVRRVECTARRG